MSKYSKDSIKPYITKNIATFSKNVLVTEAIDTLTKTKKAWDSLDFIFIIENKKLLGYIPIEALFAAPENIFLYNIMQTIITTVSDDSDKETAVITAIGKNIFEIPVLDKNKDFVGIVEPQNLLKILHEENTEDFLASAGISPKRTITNTLRLRVSQLIRFRLPWLILGLFGGMIATTIVSFFEKPLEERIALAFFIPVIVYMSDAVGTQTETLYIRSIAFGRVNTKKYLLKESVVGLNLGIVIGALLSIFAFIWLRDLKIALIIGLSMFVNITIAMFIAVLIPFFLFKLKKDPALGSGPFATVIQDILSLIVYFTIAVTVLALFK